MITYRIRGNTVSIFDFMTLRFHEINFLFLIAHSTYNSCTQYENLVKMQVYENKEIMCNPLHVNKKMRKKNEKINIFLP